MSVEKVYKCDLCGGYAARGEMRRVAVRTFDDRPEDADTVDTGPCCWSRPVNDVILHAAKLRAEITNGK